MRILGRILLFTSLLALVLVFALWIGGPALVIAIFSALIILAPLLEAPRTVAPVFVGARRRRFPPRAPPAF